MANNSPGKLAKIDIVLPICVTVAACLVMSIPYLVAPMKMPKGIAFLGHFLLVDDHAVYMSYIRQAMEGCWVFENKMTYLPHQPALINPAFLLVGITARLFGASIDTAFHIWRVLGTFVCMGGVTAIVYVLFESRFQRYVALLMCAFGSGGLGFILRAIDHWFCEGPVYPSTQMFICPHFSLPHGLFLLTVATFILAERRSSARLYIAAASLAFLNSLIRPYDMLGLWAGLGVFIVVDSILGKRIQLKKNLWRLAPIFATSFVILYYVILFRLHPVFSHWQTQNFVRKPDILMHFVYFGFPFALLCWRVMNLRQYPTNRKGDLLLFTIFFSLMCIYHSYIIPSSPQTGVALGSLLMLLGIRVLDIKNWQDFRVRNIVVISMTLVMLTFQFLDTMGYAKFAFRVSTTHQKLIAPNERLDTYAFLAQNADESDVVLCALDSANKLVKYASCHVVAGHWSMSPYIQRLREEIPRFYSGNLTESEMRSWLQEHRVNWVYVGNEERAHGKANLDDMEGLEKVFEKGTSTLYAVQFDGS